MPIAAEHATLIDHDISSSQESCIYRHLVTTHMLLKVKI